MESNMRCCVCGAFWPRLWGTVCNLPECQEEARRRMSEWRKAQATRVAAAPIAPANEDIDRAEPLC